MCNVNPWSVIDLPYYFLPNYNPFHLLLSPGIVFIYLNCLSTFQLVYFIHVLGLILSLNFVVFELRIKMQICMLCICSYQFASIDVNFKSLDSTISRNKNLISIEYIQTFSHCHSLRNAV